MPPSQHKPQDPYEPEKSTHARGSHDLHHSELCSSPFPLLCQLLDKIPYVGPHSPLPKLPVPDFYEFSKFVRFLLFRAFLACLRPFQHVFAIVALSLITGIAFVYDTMQRKFELNMIKDLFLSFFKGLPEYNLYDHVKSQGYGIEDCQVTTKDGYVLTMQRLTKSGGSPYGTKGAVILQHGLLNTSITFVLNFRGKSLAFVLCDMGYDVFLGNNRGNRYSRRHTKYTQNDLQFWDYCIDDFVLDVEAMYDQVLMLTPNKKEKVVFMGHSQGSTQAFAALSTHPKLLNQTKLLVALAPAAFVNPLESRWLIGTSKLHQWHTKAFYTLVGFTEFMPAMEWARPIVPPRIWAHLGQVMFVSLFNWSTVHWNEDFRPLYFQEVPSVTSSRNVAHWFQQVATGEFRKFDYGIKKNRLKYGTDKPPRYPLEKINCPVALCSGTSDKLVNVEKLKGFLSNVVFESTVEGWYHLDTLNAESAHKILYPSLIKLIDQLSQKE